MIFIVMGVCGCGKTTVGQALAERWGIPFTDGDEYHPDANIEKMKQGIPLTDQDRYPWLLKIHNVIKKWQLDNKSGVITCSALKRIYRNVLQYGLENPDENTIKVESGVTFIFLKGTKEVIGRRMEKRTHFMPPALLDSQLLTLEEPNAEECSVIVANVDKTFGEIIDNICDTAKRS